MSLSRRAALSSASAVLVIVAVLPAVAEFVPRVSHMADGRQAVVTINGRAAIRFRAANAGLTALMRAELTAGRLKPLARGGWQSIAAKMRGKRRAEVVAGGRLICVATSADARRARMSALSLAQTWARRVRSLFSMPAITVTPTVITVPENETRSVATGGAALGPISTADGRPAVATSAVDAVRRAVVVRGLSVGRSAVEVSCEGCRATLLVNVKRYAGRVAGGEIAEVTGNPAPSWVIERMAAQAAPRTVKLEPGAAADYGRPRVTVSSLSRGEGTRVLVPVRISGPDLIDANLLAPVEIRHRPLSHQPAAGLFYSNNPERISRYGTLFTGMLKLDERTRLLYHHQNMLGRRARLVIELINPGSLPATVQTVGSPTSPLVDTVRVGHNAGMNFLRDYLGDVGQIHRIPASSRLVLYVEHLAPSTTASGIIDLRQLSGEDLYVRVVAEPPSQPGLRPGDIAPTGSADIPARLSDHVYSAPSKRIEATYVIGDQWAFLRIGKYPIPGASQNRGLDGNYGVIYDIKVRVENPTSDTRRVQVVFEPTAGPASGIFVVGGRIIGTKTLAPPAEFVVTTISVGPGETRDLSIITMPLAGSAYPATIIVRS